jgi:hypothetical protein
MDKRAFVGVLRYKVETKAKAGYFERVRSDLNGRLTDPNPGHRPGNTPPPVGFRYSLVHPWFCH